MCILLAAWWIIKFICIAMTFQTIHNFMANVEKLAKKEKK